MRRRVDSVSRWWATHPDGLWALGIALGTLGLRLATGARRPTDWDAAQYAAGALHFDVRHGAPQPPGYWLFVTLGHGLALAGSISVPVALVIVAALASAAAAACTWLAGVDLAGRAVAAAATLLVVLSPVSWFFGSIASPYSFDALVACALVLLARRARAGSLHGAGAVAVLALGCGFRQSMVEMFIPLALIAVAGSWRGWNELARLAVVGAGSLGVWFVPMVLAQPGGLTAWWHATHGETAGAIATSSIFSTVSGGLTNLGVLGSFLLIGLGAPTAIGLVSLCLLGARRLRRPQRVDSEGPATPAAAAAGVTHPDGTGRPGDPHPRTRPIQGAAPVLAAAIVPPLAVVALEAFAKGGYLLAFLPTATIAALAPARSLARRLTRPWRTLWVLGAGAVVALAGVVSAQRFLDAPGVFPGRLVRASGPWFESPRYGAPYPVTASVIRAADDSDRALAHLRSVVDPARDVVVLSSTDGGPPVFRDLGWELPALRCALLYPPTLVYEEQGTLLFYDSASTLVLRPGGVAWFLLSPGSPETQGAARAGLARAEGTIDGFTLWRVAPGAQIDGVDVVRTTAAIHLGHGA